MRQGVKFEKPFWLFEVVKELEGVMELSFSQELMELRS